MKPTKLNFNADLKHFEGLEQDTFEALSQNIFSEIQNKYNSEHEVLEKQNLESDKFISNLNCFPSQNRDNSHDSGSDMSSLGTSE